jgi:hypothetical protein
MIDIIIDAYLLKVNGLMVGVDKQVLGNRQVRLTISRQVAPTIVQ